MPKTVVLKKATPGLAHTKRPVSTEDESDPVVMTYRALKPLRVADDETGETTHMRQFGDFVPEAVAWKRPDTWLRNGFIEVVYVNKSELDRWRKSYIRRIREEDAAAAEQNEVETELQILQARIRELEAEKQKKSIPDFNAKPPKDQIREEKIDFGGVKMAGGGVPRPVALPKPSRAPLPPQNTGQVRARTAVRRVTVPRKKG